MRIPNYKDGSIVNLMASICHARGSHTSPYNELAALPADELAKAKNVVLLVLDGLGYDYLTTNGAGSHLHQQLYCEMDSVAPPTTAASIPTFLTGVAPQQHGLTGWFTWLREVGSVVTVLPFAVRGNRSELHSNGLSPQMLFNHQSLFDQLDGECYSVMPDWLSESVFNQSLLGKAELLLHRGVTDYYQKIEQAVKQSEQRKYIYAFWPQYDSLAHQHGLQSRQLAAHFKKLDDGFAKLQKQLAGSDTVLLVTADHGFIDTTKQSRLLINDYPEIMDCLQIPLCGEPRLAYCYVQPHRRERFVELVTQQLGHAVTLHRGIDLIEQGLYGLGDVHPELASRVGEFVLEMKDNYILTQRLVGESEFYMIGQHGGLSEAEMRVPLIVAHC